MKSPEEALRETNNYPVIARGGRFYVSLSVLTILAGFLTSLLVTRATIATQEQRITKLEEAAPAGAKQVDLQSISSDVKTVNARVDAIYNLLVEIQEAHPATLPHRSPPR